MSVKITWDCDNKEVPFNIYRSSEYMDEFSPPMPIAYNLSNTMEYLDEGAEDEFFYMVGAVLNGKLYLSNQVKALFVRPGHFVVDVNFGYIPPAEHVAFVVKTN